MPDFTSFTSIRTVHITPRGTYARPGTVDDDGRPKVDDYLAVLKYPPPDFVCHVRGAKTDEDPKRPKWSGDGRLPLRGEIVDVLRNSIGRSRVLGYFVEDGWLGLLVEPIDPPKWYRQQNGTAPCHVYGTECKVENVDDFELRERLLRAIDDCRSLAELTDLSTTVRAYHLHAAQASALIVLTHYTDALARAQAQRRIP